MVAAGRARAERLGLAGATDWRLGGAVPLPVPGGALDVVLCASSLHFLGATVLREWRRRLRPGGRVGLTRPLAGDFRPSGLFADLVATDVPLPRTPADASALAEQAGFGGAYARIVQVGERRIAMVRPVR
jgi:SAM-dependent methyltransferase